MAEAPKNQAPKDQASPKAPTPKPAPKAEAHGHSITGGQDVGPVIPTPIGLDDAHPLVKEAMADPNRVGSREWMKKAREEAKEKGREHPAATSGLYDGLIAATDLQPGEFGWLLLDDQGVGTALQRDVPDLGVPAVRVFVSGASGMQFSALVTPAMAELIPPLSPNPDFRTQTVPATVGAAEVENKPAAAVRRERAETQHYTG